MTNLVLSARWKSPHLIECQNGTTFEPSPAPYILAYFKCEEHLLNGKIDFIIDTGADITTIMPDDRANIVIPRRALNDACPPRMGGIGGGVSIRYLRNITLQFQGPSGELLNPIPLERIGVLCPPAQVRKTGLYKGMPSLLGRDFLGRCHLDFTRTNITLYFEN